VSGEQASGHVPVMPAEVLDYLVPAGRIGGIYVDFTIGLGGHARLIVERMGSSGRLIGFDKDPEALAKAGRTLGPRVTLVHASFAQAREQLARIGAPQIDGALADLGVSSLQLSSAERGFSFAAEGPLDMRMDPSRELTAEQVVNQFGERELADLIYQFGEERRSRRIARAIVRSRPLKTTRELAEVVAAVNRPMKGGPSPRRRPIHPATRTFQALRIYVNSELDELEHWLRQLPDLLNAGGRAVVISFHSLEDRLVKDSFRRLSREGIYQLLTPHTVRPSPQEIRQNPRSRSARLRAVERG
jgi:16S rRNA (cytosine1402-N4)-methyltransferase